MGVALAFLGAGCAARRAPDTLHPVGSIARRLESLWWILLALALVVFVAVGVLIAYGARSDPSRNPGGWSDQRFITVGGIIIPFVILAVVAGFTIVDARDLSDAGPGRPVDIEVIGHRWWWEVRYPGTGFVSANEIRVPIDRPIHITVTSTDVIHSLWIPQVAGKADAIPGQPNHLIFDVNHTGTFTGECAEFCGIQHTNMDITLVAMSQPSYASWQSTHRSRVGDTAKLKGLAAIGRTVFEQQACAGCHTITGTSARGKVGPNLTDFAERHLLAGGATTDDDSHLARWIAHAPSVKPGTLMPSIPLSNQQVLALVAYLRTLR